jgi:hypothetical protein
MVDLHRPMRANEIVCGLLRKKAPEIAIPMLYGMVAAAKCSLQQPQARILLGRF